jgi:hypothetical protein
MLWAIKALMFAVYAAVGVLLVLAFSALARRRWKVGFRRLGSAVLAALLSIVAMPLLGGLYAVSRVDGPEASAKAYTFGSAISEQLNVAVSGLPVGLLLGLGLNRLQKRRRGPRRGA